MLHRFACVDTDADSDRSFGLVGVRARGPRHNGQSASHRSTGRGKDDVEAVPLGADLPAPGLSDGSSDHLAIRGQQLGRCPVPVLLDEGGIAAKVAEEEPAGQPGGGWSGGVVRQVLGRGCLIGCSGFDHGRIMRAARVP